MQILAFTDYVKNLMSWGDWYYRQLTRDSLVAAKLCYVQAGFLMGKAPTANTATRWQTTKVADLLEQSTVRPRLEAFEKTLNFSLADYPVASDTPPMLGLLACGPFEIPINQSLLDLYAAPELRMHNLRHNLTIEGRPMDLALFSPPTDPNQLLRDLATAGVAGPRPMGGRMVVNAFRWRVTFEVALRAVQALQDYGSQVLNLLERRDRAEQEELQQNHLVELGSYVETVQDQSIAQLEANVTALQQSRTMAQERADAYAARYNENVSAIEYQVMSSLKQSKTSALQARVVRTAETSSGRCRKYSAPPMAASNRNMCLMQRLSAWRLPRRCCRSMPTARPRPKVTGVAEANGRCSVIRQWRRCVRSMSRSWRRIMRSLRHDPALRRPCGPTVRH